MLPVTIVLPVSHVFTHVSVRRSSLMFKLHEVQVVVVPAHVLQFESQGSQILVVVFWMYIPEVHEVTHIFDSKNA